ncbi:hypothetical protein [Nannocystis punicea]|uniref:DUF4388 domain-containing protein n=1 Tax=Nannocystis punicea TaxID=2995304 RepID=A0ABY7HHK5_9BACT|nr:hypothetical protein [Nannocystis poenicansa]WAS98701.1 hypothetical protein O0S08_21415 [Nannocystis poenicansa]
MGLLSSLLAEAATSRPGEVVIETDQPLRLVHTQGGATLGEALSGEIVFDALVEVLSCEQQADLALGEPVKFDLMVDQVMWHLVGETAREMTSVRARPGADGFESSDSVNIALDEPEAPIEPTRQPRRHASGSADIDIEIQIDDDALEERAGVRLAALRPLAVEAEPRVGWPRRIAGTGWNGRAESPRRRGPAPARETGRREDLDAMALAIPSGTLAFLHRADGGAEALARALGWPLRTIGERDTPDRVWAECSALPEGAALVVRLEDPSAWLPWLLRRVEEGRRVLVETQATSPAGARRIALGVAATDRAAAWLSAIRVVHAALLGGEWTLLSFET